VSCVLGTVAKGMRTQVLLSQLRQRLDGREYEVSLALDDASNGRVSQALHFGARLSERFGRYLDGRNLGAGLLGQ